MVSSKPCRRTSSRRITDKIENLKTCRSSEGSAPHKPLPRSGGFGYPAKAHVPEPWAPLRFPSNTFPFLMTMAATPTAGLFSIKPVLDELKKISDLGFDYFELTLDPPCAHYASILEMENEDISLKEMIHSLKTAARVGAKKAV